MDARERYEELVDDLCAQHDNVAPSQMMGMPCVKRNGKMVAGFTRGSMVFKLPDPDTHARALALEGAHLFDPSRRGPAVQAVGGRTGSARRANGKPFATEAIKPAG